VTEGAVNASTDVFKIAIQGQQGHGARPHETIDAVVVGSLLVTAIQTIVSREVDPANPSVISVGRFHAGTAPNVIAGIAVLEGTIRAQDKKVRDHMQKSIVRIAQAIGKLHGAGVEIDLIPGTPPVINTQEITPVAREAALKVVGEERVLPLRTANMGGEDFSYFLDQVPGAYIRFGAQVPGREGFPAHSSRFDFDERALATGAAWFVEVAKAAGKYLEKE
jgi:hippurate hydrolase